MAENAKKAKDALADEMRKTAIQFKKAAQLENKRNKAALRRSRKTREIMRKNKKQAAKDLKAATHNQQRALATLDQQMNTRISKTNSDIAANAAQIKINAKKARDDLDAANTVFNNKMNNAEEEAKKGRSKLATEAADMDKKVRAMITGEIQSITTKTAEEFRKTRETMANDRHHADQMLQQTTTKLNGALNAASALQDKRFTQTVDNIAAAKKEAADKLEAAQNDFKTHLLALKGTVTEQFSKLNGKVTALQGTIQSNKAAQADTNRHVNAELKRMIKVGADRAAEIGKKDQELKDLMASNAADSQKSMTQLANKFNNDLDAIKKQMVKDRAHAEKALSSGTTALYDTLKKNQEAQDKVNEQLTHATARAKLDAEAALKATKEEWAGKLAGLHTTVVNNNKKADKKIKDLTGIVDENAVKDANGRAALKVISEDNKNEVSKAIRDAIKAGENRALQVEKNAKDMNTKTREAMNMKITGEISRLSKSINGQVEDLHLNTKEAREAMRKQMLFALRDAVDTAKLNLADTVKWANGKFNDLEETLADNSAASQTARDALQAKINGDKVAVHQSIVDAVAAQNKALLGLKTYADNKVDKANKKVDALGQKIKKHVQEVADQMTANAGTLKTKLDAAKKKVAEKLGNVNAKAAKRHEDAIDYIKEAIDNADEQSKAKFGKLYMDMADDRIAADNALATATNSMQAAIAKRSALYDNRFSETVNDLDAARKQATEEVKQAHSDFTSQFVVTVASIKDQSQRLEGEVQIVAEMVEDDKIVQKKLNSIVDQELEQIVANADARHTESRKARGQVLKLIAEHRAVAKDQILGLKEETKKSLRELRAHQAHLKAEAGKELSKVTTELYADLAEHAEKQADVMLGLKDNLDTSTINVANKMQQTKDAFESKLMTLTNTVTANQKEFERGVARLTGVVNNWKQVADSNRDNLKTLVKAMGKDLNKAIDKAIQKGEAEQKHVMEAGLMDISAAKKVLSSEVADRVEKMADEVFVAVTEHRGKIADNYLAFKAYAHANADKLIDYTTKGSGRRLFALGDLCTTVAALSAVPAKADAGIGRGASEVPPAFNGEPVPVSASFTKTNGLVNEWAKIMGMVRTRWPMGIGHYLLTKAQTAMQKDGVLTIGTIENHAGNWVFINAQAVGLSNAVEDFFKLAVRASAYQESLSQLTTELPKAVKVEPFYIPQQFGPDGWDGE